MMNFVYDHRFAFAVSAYTALVFSKLIWLPLLDGSAFWIADFFCFVVFPFVVAKSLGMLSLPSFGFGHKRVGNRSTGEFLFCVLITYLCLIIATKIGSFLGDKVAIAYPDNFKALYSYASKIPNQQMLRFLVMVYFAATAAVVEEVVYRGLLSHAVGKYILPKWQMIAFILISTISFGIIHIGTGISNTASAIFAGLVLSIAFTKTKDIRVTIAAHALHWLL